MSAIITWIIGHEAIVAGALVGILDLVFALVPSWASNGILHWVFLQIQGVASQPPPPSAPIAPKAS